MLYIKFHCPQFPEGQIRTSQFPHFDPAEMSRYHYITHSDLRSPKAAVVVVHAPFLSLQSSAELAGQLCKGQLAAVIEVRQKKDADCEVMDAEKGKMGCGEMYSQKGFERLG